MTSFCKSAAPAKVKVNETESPAVSAHRVTRGNIHLSKGDPIAGQFEFLCGRFQQWLVEVRQQDVLAEALAASDRDTNPSGADDNDNFRFHLQ